MNDGDAIYRINDKSGNNYHANQATLSKRPLYKTNILNGKSVGLANSANAQELLTGSITLGDDIGTVGLTVFSVAYVLTSAQRIMFQACNCRFGVSVNGNIYNYAGIIVNSGNNTFSYNNWYAFSYTVNDAAVNQYLNGILKKSADTGTLSKTAPMYLFSSGSANYFDGYVAEIICYFGMLSDADRGKVETYLNDKWSIY